MAREPGGASAFGQRGSATVATLVLLGVALFVAVAAKRVAGSVADENVQLGRAAAEIPDELGGGGAGSPLAGARVSGAVIGPPPAMVGGLGWIEALSNRWSNHQVRYNSDERDVAMVLDRAIHFGETSGSSAAEMVEAIERRAGGRPIDRLVISGHGEEGVQHISSTQAIELDESGRLKGSEELARLRPLFAEGGEVWLTGCYTGGGPEGERLLTELAKLWQVPVRANTAIDRIFFPGYDGASLKAIPTAGGGVRIETDEGLLPDVLTFFGYPFRDDWARQDIKVATESQLRRWDLDRRYDKARAMLGGYRSEADGASLLRLFETAPPKDRLELYRYIEHHPWEGDFRRGWGVNNDSLWNGLSEAHRERLRALLEAA